MARRKIVAIGDLHGDFYRLQRIMEEHELLLKSTLAWNPEIKNVDFILLGDYGDWRGEVLEGDPSQWIYGARKIYFFLQHLQENIAKLTQADAAFASRFYPLLGNHDAMMFDSLAILDFFPEAQLLEILPQVRNFWEAQRVLTKYGFKGEAIDIFFKFLNWFMQGGEVTISSFGGFGAWKEALQGELGAFLQQNLQLMVTVGGWLFVHSLADQERFHLPVEEIATLEPDLYALAREDFLWGRKIWGYDYLNGGRTAKFTQEEVEAILLKMRVKGVVMGHTPLHKNFPYKAYKGKIFNLDCHGQPQSKPWVRYYEADNAPSQESELVEAVS